MHAFLWTLQVLLAGYFAVAGLIKINVPTGPATRRFTWLAGVSPTRVHFLGGLELLVAIGLILPAITGVATVLTPVAAAVAALLMISALLMGLRRRALRWLPALLLVLAAAVVVAWGRFGPYPL